jgi:hypothetical protein
MELRKPGNSDLRISKIGIGAWAPLPYLYLALLCRTIRHGDQCWQHVD